MADNVPFRRLAPIIPPPEWYAEKEREGYAAFKAKVAALLREIEWHMTDCSEGCGTSTECPGCLAPQYEGHSPSCALLALLLECEA